MPALLRIPTVNTRGDHVGDVYAIIIRTFEFDGTAGQVSTSSARLKDVDGRTRVSAHTVSPQWLPGTEWSPAAWNMGSSKGTQPSTNYWLTPNPTVTPARPARSQAAPGQGEPCGRGHGHPRHHVSGHKRAPSMVSRCSPTGGLLSPATDDTHSTMPCSYRAPEKVLPT
jgi:hypothetical protein